MPASTTTDQSEPPTESPAVPEDVDSSGAKLVYVYLSSVVETTVEAAADALGLKLIELYPILRSLERAGHVERAGGAYRLAD